MAVLAQSDAYAGAQGEGEHAREAPALADACLGKPDQAGVVVDAAGQRQKGADALGHGVAVGQERDHRAHAVDRTVGKYEAANGDAHGARAAVLGGEYLDDAAHTAQKGGLVGAVGVDDDGAQDLVCAKVDEADLGAGAADVDAADDVARDVGSRIGHGFCLGVLLCSGHFTIHPSSKNMPGSMPLTTATW